MLNGIKITYHNALLIMGAFLLNITMLYAQKRFDVFYVAGNYNFLKSTNINQNNYEKAWAANLSIPFLFNDSSIWLTTLDYQHYNLPNEHNTADNPVTVFNLHGCIIRTGYIKKISSKQAIHALFIPRVMTDFNATLGNALQLGGMVMYEKIKNKNLMWRAGVIYNQEFFGPFITPVLYLDWHITPTLKFAGLLPVYGKLYIEPNKNISTGLHFVGLTTSYRINETDFENYYVQRDAIDVSAFLNLRLVSTIYVEGRIGYSLSKDYGLYAENEKATVTFPLFAIGDNRTRANNEFAGSPFMHFRLLYSLPTQ
ncbi:MAG: hypothetical protein JNK61_09490 [Bacteroidia bacterium]|nr:hypothetical protein [Bacteroidia bacterium]